MTPATDRITACRSGLGRDTADDDTTAAIAAKAAPTEAPA